jgi:hypothetical protein
MNGIQDLMISTRLGVQVGVKQSLKVLLQGEEIHFDKWRSHLEEMEL